MRQRLYDDMLAEHQRESQLAADQEFVKLHAPKDPPSFSGLIAVPTHMLPITTSDAIGRALGKDFKKYTL